VRAPGISNWDSILMLLVKYIDPLYWNYSSDVYADQCCRTRPL